MVEFWIGDDGYMMWVETRLLYFLNKTWKPILMEINLLLSYILHNSITCVEK